MKNILLSFLTLLLTFHALAQKNDQIIIQKDFENNSLFFVFPQDYVTNNRHIDFKVDFTINYDKEKKQPQQVQMNFTVFSRNPVKDLSHIQIKGSNQSTTLTKSFKKFFIEKHDRKTWASRFGTNIEYDQLLRIIDPKHENSLEVHATNLSFITHPDRKVKEEYQVAYQTLTYNFD